MKIILSFIIILFIGISCSETPVDSPLKVSIKTESTSAVYETWAMLNIKNKASRNAYLIHKSDRIGFWTLEKAFKDSWIDVSKDTSFCRWIPTIQKVKIEPDEIYHDSVLVLRVGRYRINFPFTWDENETETESLSPVEFDVE